MYFYRWGFIDTLLIENNFRSYCEFMLYNIYSILDSIFYNLMTLFVSRVVIQKTCSAALIYAN